MATQTPIWVYDGRELEVTAKFYATQTGTDVLTDPTAATFEYGSESTGATTTLWPTTSAKITHPSTGVLQLKIDTTGLAVNGTVVLYCTVRATTGLKVAGSTKVVVRPRPLQPTTANVP